MNISPIESKMVEFIKRPETLEKLNKINNKNEKEKVEVASKQIRLEDESSDKENVKQEESLMNMIKEVLTELDSNNIDVNIGFKIVDDFKDPIIEVVDKESNKVIKQIPSEEFIERMKNMDDLKGILFDDKF